MTTIKKKLMLPALILIISAAALFVPQGANAQTTNTPPENPFQSLIQKIADTFHLNKSDVQKVFDQHKTDMMNNRQQNFQNRLDQDVKNGKITEAQKTLILNKLEEMKNTKDKNMQDWKNMTPAQRKAAMDAWKQSIEDWAKQNGIDPNYLLRMQIRGHGMMGK